MNFEGRASKPLLLKILLGKKFEDSDAAGQFIW